MLKFKKDVKYMSNPVQIEATHDHLIIHGDAPETQLPFHNMEATAVNNLELQISDASHSSEITLQFTLKTDLKKVLNVLQKHEIYVNTVNTERKRKRDGSPLESSSSPSTNHDEVFEFQPFAFQARRSTRIKKRRRRMLTETNQNWGDDEELLDWVDEGVTEAGTGIVNLGNTCYMGAVLSALAHLSGFMEDMSSENLWKSVENRLEESSVFKPLRDILTSTKAEVSPKNLKEILADHHHAFEGFEQEDAHEFFMCILERIQSDLIASLDPLQVIEMSPVENNFSGLFVYTYTCEKCAHETQATESFREIGLAVPRDKQLGDRKLARNELLSISDLFNFHFSPHTIEKHCSSCGYGFSTCQILMKQVPRVLCLQFKRFYHEFTGGNVIIKKTSNQIKIEDELSVNGACAKDVILPEGVKKLSKFSLKSFLNHRGATIRRGHYTTCAKSIAKDKSQWKVINDTHTKTIDSDDVESEIFRREHRRDIYLAFFEIRSG